MPAATRGLFRLCAGRSSLVKVAGRVGWLRVFMRVLLVTFGGWFLRAAALFSRDKFWPSRLIRRRQELLPAMVAAKIKRLPIPFGAERRRLIHRHSTNRVFSHNLVILRASHLQILPAVSP